MKITLYNDTGGGKESITFEVDFAIFEPEAVYLCNGDPTAWNHDERYITPRYERLMDDNGMPALHNGEQLWYAGSPGCEVVYKIAAIPTAGRRYWEYLGTWYEHFCVETEAPRVIIKEIEAAPVSPPVQETALHAPEPVRKRSLQAFFDWMHQNDD